MKSFLAAGILLTILLGLSPRLPAQPTPAAPVSASSATGWVPHLGLTVNPDQFHFGLHLHIGTSGAGFLWRPNFDIGVGDGATVAAVNIDVIRRFPDSPNNWAPFVGGGVSANFNEYDTPRFSPNEAGGLGSNFESGFGFILIGGFERDLGGETIFLQARFGLLDSPELRATGGWTIFR